MENQIPKTNEEKKDNKKGIVIFLVLTLFLSLGGNGVLVYLLSLEKGKVAEQIEIVKTVYVERDNVKSELLNLQKEYETLKTNDARLQAEIDEKKIQIEQLLKEAEKHKGDAYVIAKLRKETETLRAIMQGYVHTIDSLNTLNKTLVVEKENVLKDLSSEKEKSNKLVSEKKELQSVIDKGSKLSCFGITATGINLKSGGKKQSPTNKAKRTDMIRVSYSLGENKIAKSGAKDVYVRIITPDGKELAKNYDDNYRFIFNGSAGYYAGKTQINYANAEISVVTVCEGSSAFVPGNYMIEITADDVVIGSTTLKLD
jgi:hypothetical protein